MKSLPPFFLLMFVVPAVLMVLLAAYIAGGTTLSCQRVEPRQIDCTVSDRRWFGLVEAGVTAVKQLKGAHLESYECEDTDSSGNRVTKQCEKLALDSAKGTLYPDLLTSSVSDVNGFVDSKDSSLTVYNNRWVFSGAVSGFALLWIGVGSFMFRQTFQRKDGRGQRRKGSGS